MNLFENCNRSAIPTLMGYCNWKCLNIVFFIDSELVWKMLANRYVISSKNVKECFCSWSLPLNEVLSWNYMNIAPSSAMNLCTKSYRKIWGFNRKHEKIRTWTLSCSNTPLKYMKIALSLIIDTCAIFDENWFDGSGSKSIISFDSEKDIQIDNKRN